MDRLHLTRHLTEMHPQLKTKEADFAVKVILDALCGTLAKGGRIEIRGFGSFSLNQSRAKEKRNSRSGAKYNEPAKYSPQFKPAKQLRARVSEGKRIDARCLERTEHGRSDQAERRGGGRSRSWNAVTTCLD